MTLNDNLFYYLLKLFFWAREGFNEILNWSNPYKKSNPIAHPTTFPKHFPNFHFQIFTISNFDFKRQTISISNVDCQTEISIFTFTICIFDVQISRCTPRCECVQFFSITNRRRAHFIPNVFNFSNRQKIRTNFKFFTVPFNIRSMRFAAPFSRRHIVLANHKPSDSKPNRKTNRKNNFTIVSNFTKSNLKNEFHKFKFEEDSVLIKFEWISMTYEIWNFQDTNHWQISMVLRILHSNRK